METIIHFRKKMMVNHHFIVKKNKKLDTRGKKRNYESSLPIYYKIEGNYFKGKIWVLYKLKTKTKL